MTSRRIALIRSSLALVVLASATLLAIPGLAAAEEPSDTSATPALTKVETKFVCMINDQVFGKVQIPVEVEGRTYYGCCEMCKDRLAKDSASRVAVDPVSGKEVDKATAVIGALPNGNVLYFESQESLDSYNAKVRG